MHIARIRFGLLCSLIALLLIAQAPSALSAELSALKLLTPTKGQTFKQGGELILQYEVPAESQRNAGVDVFLIDSSGAKLLLRNHGPHVVNSGKCTIHVPLNKDFNGSLVAAGTFRLGIAPSSYESLPSQSALVLSDKFSILPNENVQMGTLRGNIPIRNPAMDTADKVAAYKQMEYLVVASDRKVVASVRPDATGLFSLQLPSGKYFFTFGNLGVHYSGIDHVVTVGDSYPLPLSSIETDIEIASIRPTQQRYGGSQMTPRGVPAEFTITNGQTTDLQITMEP